MIEILRRLRAVILFISMVVISMAAGCSTTKAVVPTAAYPAASSEQGAPIAQASEAYPSGAKPQQPSMSSSTLPATPDLSATAPLTQNTATPVAMQAAQLPDSNSAEWVKWVDGLSLPVDIAFLPNAPRKAYILQQGGVIAVADDGKLLSQPLLDLTGTAVRGGNEQGLLGIALDPLFTENRFFYLDYTDGNGNTVVARYQAAGDFLTADPASQKVILQVSQPYPNHNGGCLAFGPDGYLYIALGDGGSANDPQGNGQNLDTLLGKILRIDVRGEPYAIPADNPFANGGGRPEIWAYGLRNPWRFSFDRATGDLYIADVGQNKWEEVDFQPAGSAGGINYGWNYREGQHEFKGTPPQGLVMTDPVVDYHHSVGGCSVTGGYVYRGSALSAWQGVYLYGDYCTGFVWGLLKQGETWQNAQLFSTGLNISSFGQDANGELYLLDLNTGQVLKLVPRP